MKAKITCIKPFRETLPFEKVVRVYHCWAFEACLADDVARRDLHLFDGLLSCTWKQLSVVSKSEKKFVNNVNVSRSFVCK